MKWRIVFFAILFFVAGIGVGFWGHRYIERPESIKKISPSHRVRRERQIRQSGYTFISPLLECEASESFIATEFLSFKTELESKIAQLSSAHSGSSVSVYFRDLNNGPWYGIDEDVTFTPASLLKTPLMIALLKQAEGDSSFLSRVVVFDPALLEAGLLPEQTIEPSEKLEKGVAYTIDELMTRMIVYSDNESMQVLLKEIDDKIYDSVYRDLGLRLPNIAISENYMTVKDYASFFRILYNASYLNKNMSEKALKILSSTAYTNGLVSGVPSNITVAHKFGERVYSDGKGTQLHDCGIVYYPKLPYLLCVMTRGESIEKDSTIIAEVSKFVYDGVSAEVAEK